MSLQSQRPRLITSSTHLPVPTSSSPSSAEGSISPLLPAFVPNIASLRPSMSRHSTTHSIPVPSSRTPFLTPSMTNSIPACGMKLLMPTVRQARMAPTISLSRIPSAKSSPAKPSRSRAGSIVVTPQPSPDLSAAQTISVDWIGGSCRFEVVEEQIELEGYQIYAVEKW